ncbi:MAG: ABC transporter substrate-binding protein [Gammaproteobacteria bacterium]
MRKFTIFSFKIAVYKVIPVLFLLLFLTEGARTDETRSREVVLGNSAAYRGASRDLGIELYRGAMAYFEMINSKGGINAKPIRILALDDNYNPQPAVANTIKLIEEYKLNLLFGYVGTPTVTRMLPLLKKFEKEHVFLFFPFTGAEPQRQYPYDRYVFNLRASYGEETARLVNLFVGLGLKKIAVFYQIDAYGRSGWNGVRHALREHGLKIFSEATYRRGAQFTDSLDAQVQIIKESGAEAIISVGAYQACAGFIRDARDAGFTGPIANVSFVGSEKMLALLRETEEKNGRDYTYNLVNSQVVPSYEDTDIPAVRHYRSLMKEINPKGPEAFMGPDYQSPEFSFVSFEGFLNARLMVEILKRLEDVGDKSQIGHAIETMGKIDIGLLEPVEFGPGKHQALDKVYFTTVSDGRFVPIRDDSWWVR